MTLQSSVTLTALMLLSLTPRMGAAQGTSTASITGVVRDTSGGVLPGVTVEASSPALIEKVRTTVTDASGQYRITELRPGIYTVSFSLIGFSQFRREAVELTTNFTATINAELSVGALEETITVSGESPLVDTRNVTQQKTVSQEVLTAVPTSKTMIAMAQLMPAATAAPSAQDVGGSRGEATSRISIHGTKATAATLLIDGLSYNRTSAAFGRGFMVNPLSSQEIVLDLGAGGSAEYTAPGVALNLVPRDGGNRFSGTFFAAGMNRSLQSDNLSTELQDAGLLTVNSMNNIYDVNAVVAGPISADKLWFSTSHRRWGRDERIANLFHDSDFSDFIYTTDLSRPVDAREDFHHHDIRLTWQAAQKHKVTGSFYWQSNNQTDNFATLSTGTRAIDAAQRYCHTENLYQGTWTHPRTSRLLFEAGYSLLIEDDSTFENPCVGSPYRIEVRDTALNFLYNGQGTHSINHQHPDNWRFSASYVTGAHSFKAGIRTITNLWQKESYSDRPTFLPVSYTLNNRVPTGLTQFRSPTTGGHTRHVTTGLFVQDQWQINRLSLTMGLRYEYVNAWAKAVDQPGGLLADPASYPSAECLPCWHDLNPRVGGAFDLFGNGRTAIKGSVGRYVELMNVAVADQFAPYAAAVNSTTRSWTDSNNNWYPDCNLRNPGLNGECGPMANQAFGQTDSRTRPDPEWITGWGKRGYTWMTSVSVDHELRSGVALNAGYYRTWFGNFTVTDNQLVTPLDYDPYCITAPSDARLPSQISGQQICGFYDLSPSRSGQVNNVVTLAKNFGELTEVYNGVDAQFNARVGESTISGGWNMGNTTNVLVTFPAESNSKISQCFVVDSPQQLYNCESQNPYLHQFRFNGAVPLRQGILLAVVYQNLPGPNYTALLTVPTAQIAPSLGRNLSGNTRTVTIDLLERYKYFTDARINQLDVRLSKVFRIGAARLQANFDVYNLTDDNTVLQVRGQYNANWLQPTQILNARMFKFGVQYDF
jgi:hypothetical protein